MSSKKSSMTPLMRDSIAYSALAPKAICNCHHTGDGAFSQHVGYGGHGPCKATPVDGRNECLCAQFTWKGWTKEYLAFLQAKGHSV
jgi:hypothetical protein